MECSVHSPCGRYLVRYKSNTESMCIDVIPKVSAFESSSSLHYIALLREIQVSEITTAAGVRKDFTGFSDMTYNAMIGRSPCVKFFIETCEEMKSRITKEVAQRIHGPCENANANNKNDESEISLLSESSRTQRFFTLDYDVDFTRAVFPVPLVEITNPDDLQRMTALYNHRNNNAITDPISTTTMNSGLNRVHINNEKSKNTTGVVEFRNISNSESNNSDKSKNKDSKAVISKLQTENEKLKRENEALVRLSREKMLEMQRLCEDFQQRVEGAREAERLMKKLSALRLRLQQTETERDEAHAAFARLKKQQQQQQQQQLQRKLQVTPPRDSLPLKRRSRFDTPSPAPVRRRSQQSHRRRLAGDSPAPRGRTGGRAEEIPQRPRSRSMGGGGSSGGGGGVGVKKRLWSEEGSSSRCSSASQYSRSSSCERLYRTPTASSRLHQRDAPIYIPHRAIFR